MDKADLLKRVKLQMDLEGLTQRQLADRVGSTQGHLSKVLEGKFKRESRVVRKLDAFAAPQRVSDNEVELVQLCRRLAESVPVSDILRLMHIIEKICIK